METDASWSGDRGEHAVLFAFRWGGLDRRGFRRGRRSLKLGHKVLALLTEAADLGGVGD